MFAHRQLLALQRQLEQLTTAPDLDTTSLSSALDKYEQQRVHAGRLKESTLAQYKAALRQLRSLLGDRLLCEITPADYQWAVDQVATGSLAATFGAWSAALHWLDRNGHPGCRDLIPERRPRSRCRERYLDDAELRLWWQGLALCEYERLIRPRTAVAFRLLTLVPLRANEAATLTRSAVDLLGKCIRLPDSKTGRRILPLSDLAVEILRQKMPDAGRYVFPG